MDIVSISTLLSSIKSATDIAKLIKNSDVSLEKAEIKLKLAELISALADAKIEVADIQQTLIDKDSAIRSLQEKFAIRESVVWEEPVYWLQDGQDKKGPYCQRCYDVDEKLVRLQGSGDGHWVCACCKFTFMSTRYKESLRIHNSRGHDPYA